MGGYVNVISLHFFITLFFFMAHLDVVKHMVVTKLKRSLFPVQHGNNSLKYAVSFSFFYNCKCDRL